MRIRTKGLNDRLATLNKSFTDKGTRISFSYNDKSGRVTVSCIITKIIDDIIYCDCISDHLEECPKVSDILSAKKKLTIMDRIFSGKSEYFNMDLTKRVSWSPGQAIIEPYNGGYKIISSNISMPILFTTSSQEHLLDLVDP